MLSIERIYRIGDFFFKYRSYLPLVLAVFFILEIPYFYYPRSSIRWEVAFEVVCLLVALFGYAIRVVTIGYARAGTSGRSIKEQKSDSLNTDGMYAVVRNALYLGNFFIILGISILSQDWRVVLINVLLFICFYFPIIMREEQYLRSSFADAFDAYAARTPAIVPDFRRWKRPELRFNFARVLRREHDSLLAIIFTFFAIGTLRESAITGGFRIARLWAPVLIVILMIWGVLKLLKGRLKDVEKDSPR